MMVPAISIPNFRPLSFACTTLPTLWFKVIDHMQCQCVSVGALEKRVKLQKSRKICDWTYKSGQEKKKIVAGPVENRRKAINE